RTFSDASMAPIFPAGSGADSRWSSDSMMLLGPGSHAADGGVAPGLNLLWFDATGAIRSEEDGPNAVLTDRSDFTAATASPISLGAANARWGVAWVETKSDDAGTYDTLMYDELDCQWGAGAPAARGAARMSPYVGILPERRGRRRRRVERVARRGRGGGEAAARRRRGGGEAGGRGGQGAKFPKIGTRQRPPSRPRECRTPAETGSFVPSAEAHEMLGTHWVFERGSRRVALIWTGQR